MQSTPKDEMFCDLSRRAQTRQKSSLQLFLRQRLDCLPEGILVVLPTLEGTRLRDACSCHVGQLLCVCDYCSASMTVRQPRELKRRQLHYTCPTTSLRWGVKRVGA